ncbi:uncharacterized protein LOC135464097 [Liolophura sinensis]|uniref:uncharacterized protein LOC135464097 n=1 Tax=Liolophura sinensis TaxID=3198878 RepID=UPI003158362D
MTSMEDSRPLTMEHLLKEAMLLHRNTVKELTDTKEKYDKVQLSKKSLLDKAKVVQRECHLLKQENKHLKEVKETLKGRSDEIGCKMCHYLQQSMEALKDAYTKTMEEKDRTIRMLEERLAEKSQACNKSWNSDGGKEESIVSRGVAGGCKGTSPDTTSDRGDRKSVSPDKGEELHTNFQGKKSANAEISPGTHPDSEDVSPGSRRNNLKLFKSRHKRNRYAETPLSGGPVKSNGRLKTGGPIRSRVGESNTEVSQSDSCNPRSHVTKERSNRAREKEQLGNLFLLDTDKLDSSEDSPQKSAKRPRILEGDGSFVLELDSPVKIHPSCKLLRKVTLRPNIIVPDTMAVDYYDDVDGSEDNADVKIDEGKNLGSVSRGFEDNTEQIYLGPPTASSTQVIKPVTTTANKVQSSCKGDAPEDMSSDMDTTVIDRFQPDQKSKKLSLDVTNANNNSLNLDEDNLPLSPVFIGVKQTHLKPTSFKSPSLFDDDKMAEHEKENASFLVDSESPFLLRQLPTSGQRSNIPEDWSDGESQSPSLLHRRDVEKSTETSKQSETLSQNSLRRSNRKMKSKKNAPEFRQTTLTQSFDWSTKTSKSPELQEIQNLELHLSPPSLVKQKKNGKAGDTGRKKDDSENCRSVSEFKIPVSPSGKLLKTRSLPKKKPYSQTGHTTTSSSRGCLPEFDPDETVPPEMLQMSLRDLPKGDNSSQCQLNLPTCSLAENHNASIDPAVQLSVDYPDTLVNTEDPRSPPCVKRGNKTESLKGKTLEEESQLLPSSSKSFKFFPGRPSSKLPLDESPEGDASDEAPKGDPSDDAPETGVSHSNLESGERREKGTQEMSLNCSYDRVPRKKSLGFAYVDVVRKRDERQKLKGYFCQECEDYFKDVGLSEEERAQRMQKCSRHRARYVPPSTPEHFWSIGFPDTPECEERGYIKKDSQKGPSRFRRKKRLEKRFKGKTEGEEDEISGDQKAEDLNSSNLIFD